MEISQTIFGYAFLILMLLGFLGLLMEAIKSAFKIGSRYNFSKNETSFDEDFDNLFSKWQKKFKEDEYDAEIHIKVKSNPKS